MNEVGENERIARLDDMAQVKAGRLTLEMAKQRAIERQQRSGLSKSNFQAKLSQATGRARQSS